jgi:hypothetical protein
MMTRWIFVALALVLVGCGTEQASPVAPSATFPAGPTTLIVPVPLPIIQPTPQIPTPPPVDTPPAPSQPGPSFFEFTTAFRYTSSTPTEQEWIFAAVGSPDVTGYTWNFGDGTSAASGRRTEHHIYVGRLHDTQTFIVTVSAHSREGDMTKKRTIAVTFDHDIPE